jgi:hypothetical protein
MHLSTMATSAADLGTNPPDIGPVDFVLVGVILLMVIVAFWIPSRRFRASC